MDSGHREPRLRPSPRTIFSQQFAALFEAAGKPTLRRVAAAAEARMRAARSPGQKGGASVQRISDWKSGRNVPARFESLLPVLLTLVEEARKSSAPVPPALLDVQEWQRLWAASNAWDPVSDSTECPYLGLTSYGRDDAELFFGRSRPTAELAELVRTTVGPAGHGGIVMLVGASGAGKSSLLAAGLLPALADPVEEWAVAAMTPGSAPVEALLATVRAESDTKPAESGSVATDVAGPVGEVLLGAVCAGSGMEPAESGSVSTDVIEPADEASLAAVRAEFDAKPAGPGSLSTDATGPANEALLAAVCAGSDTRPAESGSLSTEATDRSGAALGDSAGSGAGLSRESRSEKTSAAAESIAAAVAAWGAGKRRLLIIDQLEELFTLCRSEDERALFLATLEHLAIRGEREPTAVVIAVRADFYARCLDIPVLEDALKHRSYLLGPMRLDELAEAMNRPAELAGYKLESGLEELVITELCGLGGDRRAYDPGALPLVSHVMAAVWQRRDGTRLTIDGYRAAGGVIGSVAATAEKAWGELTDFQQSIGKQVLLGLVAVGDDSRDTRRKVTRTELIQQTVDAAETALEVLARTRLITLDAESAYLTHEIVLDAWPRLRTWIDEDRVGYLERQRLQADASDWATQGRDPGLLYRGARLITMQEHADKGAIGAVAEEFLAASAAGRRRTQRRSSARMAALALLGVIALVLAGVAFVQSGTAKTERDNAVFAAVLAESDRLETTDPSLSAQLVLAADKLRPGDPEVRARLLNTQNMALASTLPGHEGFVHAMAVRPDGRFIASGGSDKTVRLWDISDRRHPRGVGRPLTGSTGLVDAVAFSPDGSLLASASGYETVQLWDVRDPDHPTMIGTPLPSGYPYMLVFGADGKTLVTASKDLPIMFWDIGDPTRPTPIGTPIPKLSSDPPAFVTVGPDLRTAVTVGLNGETLLWRISDPHSAAVSVRLTSDALSAASSRESAFTPDAVSAAISPDGAVVAVAGREAIHLWDIRDPVAPRAIGQPLKIGPPPSVGTPIAFSPDGRTVVAVSDRGTATAWNIADPDHPATVGGRLAGTKGSVTAICFAPDGQTVVTGGQDGAVRVWSMPRIGSGDSLTRAYEPIIDASGTRMVVRSGDGAVEVWQISDPKTPRRLGRLELPLSSATNMAMTSDGRLLVVGGERYLGVLIDISDPAAMRVLTELPAETGQLSAVGFSPDSRLLATAGLTGASGTTNDVIRVWDVSDPARPRAVGEPISTAHDYPFDVRFSPDGRRLAVARMEESVTMWDIANPAAPKRLGHIAAGQAQSGITLAFTSDGRTLVTSGDDLRIRVWDIQNPSEPVAIDAPLIGHTSLIGSMSFSPDGRLLASGGLDGIQLWDFTNPRKPEPIKHPVTAAASSTFWIAAFHPGGAYLVGAGSDGVRFWDLDPQHSIARICGATTPRLSAEVWQDHLPGLPYRQPCE
ncbi:WD40 repeat domain-containing protein [Nocardia sp. CA-119907]|uniref:WD40 repeat domain-containing protein n=1 Tax=Nocardia sp. CA-119907 TaxID=3239973 RepID=UPI003D964379